MHAVHRAECKQTPFSLAPQSAKPILSCRLHLHTCEANSIIWTEAFRCLSLQPAGLFGAATGIISPRRALSGHELICMKSFLAISDSGFERMIYISPTRKNGWIPYLESERWEEGEMRGGKKAL